MRHENSRVAPRTPCKARLCATFDLIRGGLCPLELPLRKRTADPIERVYRQAERTAIRRFFFCWGRAEAAWGGSGKEKSCRYFLPKAEKFFSGAAGIFWRRGRKKRPVSRWWATGRFAVFQRRNEVRYTKLPHSAEDIYNVPHLFAQIN